jgi:hypothetical protein
MREIFTTVGFDTRGMSETIEDLLADINSDVFLPGLQREFVWSPNQIEMLFDSLIRGYPIGVLLKWDIRRARDDYFAYKFIPNYIADDGRIPRPITDQDFTRNNEGVEDADADSLVIDGQQRLNSLYIGLYGSIATYTGGSGRTRDESRFWDEKKLCVNLFGHPQHDQEGLSGDYEFTFKKSSLFGDDDEFGYENRAGTHRYWFPLPDAIASDGLLLDQSDLRRLARDRVRSTTMEANEETRDALKDAASLVMDEFYHNVMKSELPVETIKKDNHHIKEIFQRINIQGEEPRPYQLMLSKLMSTWPYMEDRPFNPRQKVEDWVEEFKREHAGYETQIDRDLFMRYSYMLLDDDLAGKSSVNNLSDTDLETLRTKWMDGPPAYSYAPFEWFPRAMELSLQSLLDIGLSEYTMDSKSHIALLGKFFYENPDVDHTAAEVRNDIFKFFAILLLLNESHGLLRRTKARVMMSVLSENKGDLSSFPALQLFNTLGVSPAREDIERVVEHARYNPNATGSVTFTSRNVAAVLGLLDGIYGDRNISDYEVDHIFPASRDDEVEEAAGEDIDIHRLGNLQLLHHRVNNNEKGTQWPKDWLGALSEGEQRRYRNENQYPDTVDMSPENFTEFTEKREKLIKQALIDRYVSSSTEEK